MRSKGRQPPSAFFLDPNHNMALVTANMTRKPVQLGRDASQTTVRSRTETDTSHKLPWLGVLAKGSRKESIIT